MFKTGLFVHTFPTKWGPLCLVFTHGDPPTIWVAGFDVAEVVRHTENLGLGTPVADPATTLVQLINDYTDGDLAALGRVAVPASGSKAVAEMRKALLSVPPGETVSYGELATLAGCPGAARVAGSACAGNPVALFRPCHRVVRADGSIGQYAYGTEIKQALLNHEHNYQVTASLKSH